MLLPFCIGMAAVAALHFSLVHPQLVLPTKATAVLPSPSVDHVAAAPRPGLPDVARIEILRHWAQPAQCHQDPDTPYPLCNLEVNSQARIHRTAAAPPGPLHVAGECRYVDVSRPWQRPLAYDWIELWLPAGQTYDDWELAMQINQPRRDWGLKPGSLVGVSCRVVDPVHPSRYTVGKVPKE